MADRCPMCGGTEKAPRDVNVWYEPNPGEDEGHSEIVKCLDVFHPSGSRGQGSTSTIGRGTKEGKLKAQKQAGHR